MAIDKDQRTAAQQQLAHDTKRVRAFKDMLNTEGWKLYQELLNHHIGERTKGFFDEPNGDLNALRKEDHNKGAVFGLIFARDLPEYTIAMFNQVASGPATDEENDE